MALTQLIIDCILLAFAAGLVYGIFGSGSGLVMAPGYYYVARHFHLAPDHRMQVAIATTAAASAIIGLFAARVQRKANNIDYSSIKKVAPGLTVGTLLAVFLLNTVPSDFLKHLFGIVVLGVAAWLWFYRQEKDQRQWSLNGFSNHIKTSIIGLLWFLLGIAVFTVPYLHKCGISMKKAIGCASTIGGVFSALAAILLAITGYFTVGANATHIGYINLLMLGVSVIPSAYAGIIGSKLSHRIPPNIIKKTYVGLVSLVGLLMLI